jgi:hypothetical protein
VIEVSEGKIEGLLWAALLIRESLYSWGMPNFFSYAPVGLITFFGLPFFGGRIDRRALNAYNLF